MKLYVATFKNARGRYLVERAGNGYEGQKIHDARQEKYGNKPDSETGLYLGEMWRWHATEDLKSLKEFTPKAAR